MQGVRNVVNCNLREGCGISFPAHHCPYFAHQSFHQVTCSMHSAQFHAHHKQQAVLKVRITSWPYRVRKSHCQTSRHSTFHSLIHVKALIEFFAYVLSVAHNSKLYVLTVQVEIDMVLACAVYKKA